MEKRFKVYCYNAPWKTPKWFLSRLSATLSARELNREMRAKGYIWRFYPVERQERVDDLCSPLSYTQRTLDYL